MTTLELFFDLVYVFAFTQVTGFMAESRTAVGVVEGLTILLTLWWSWTSYSWLANQTRVDVGVAKAGLSVALAAMFVVSLATPRHSATGAELSSSSSLTSSCASSMGSSTSPRPVATRASADSSIDLSGRCSSASS